jgi:Tol biopolymer transport system component
VGRVLAKGFLSSPAWSPNGRRIAFVRYRWPDWAADWTSDIYVIRRDGTHLHRITSTRRAREDELDWSSANRIVFRRTPVRFRFKRYELFRMRPDGTHLRRLTHNDVADRFPDSSPDGKKIAFVRGGEVWMMDASGENAVSLATGSSPAWAPDATVIAYIASADGAIHAVSPSGTAPFEDAVVGSPVSNGEIYGLDWQPIPPP